MVSAASASCVPAYVLLIALIAVTILLVWSARQKGKNMKVVPVGVGDPAAQARFLERYKPFLEEYPEIMALLKKTFLRALKNPPEDQIDAISALPDDDPRVIAFDDKVWADRLVFYFGRMAVDDFGEVLNLAGNGRGLGAYKILRGMYERIVTAVYIAKNPAESRVFLEEEAIQKWKLWSSALRAMPDLKDQYTAKQIAGLEEAYKKAKAKKEVSVCNKCNQPKTAEAWTRVDLFSMAQKSDKGLAELYGSCYQEPTFHSHATSFGVSSRIRRNDEDTGWTFRELSEKEARSAVLLSHNLILRVLSLQNDYFNLGLEEEIKKRLLAFIELWKKIPKA